MLRFLLMVLNAAAVGFLNYRLLKIYEQPVSNLKKWSTFAGGIILLLLPVTMIFGILKPSPAYLVIYPMGILFFVYLFRLPD